MQKPLKILIINYEHPPLGGGGGVCTQTVSKALVAKGHTVHILTTGIKGLPKESDEDGVKIFRVPVIGRKELATASNLSMFTFPLTSIPKGISLCRKYKYDVINTHFYAPSGPTGMVLSLIFKIPNILYIHGADVYDPTRINKTPAGKGLLSFLLRLNAKLQSKIAKKIACQSSDTKKNIEIYINPKKEITIIPLPFAKPHHPKASKASLGLNPKNYYILSAGRVVKRKGYEYLLYALTLLPPSIHAIIMGDGPELENLKKLAFELRIENRVNFLGFIEKESEKYKYFSAADLFVLSSLHEGMGIVVQEAMEFGLPIVATNHGGQVDLIEDQKNGILVPPANPQELAKAIVTVFKSKKLSKSFGKENREKIKNYYSDYIADKYLEIFYKSLMDI